MPEEEEKIMNTQGISEDSACAEDEALKSRGGFSLSFSVFIPLFLLAAAAALVAIIAGNGAYPQGADVFFHIYRADVLAQSAREGIFFPSYDPLWFSGYALFRFVPPLSSALLAVCEALAGFVSSSGYLIYVGLLFYCCTLVWYFIGKNQERPYLGAFLGLVWFFQPYSMKLLFTDGNLAQSLGLLVLLPLFISACVRYFETECVGRLVCISVVSCLFVLTSSGLFFMSFFAFLIFMLGKLVSGEGRKGCGSILLSILFGVIASGLWLVPYLKSGVLSKAYDADFAKALQNLTDSFNIKAYLNGNNTAYLGLSFAVLLLFLIVFSKQNKKYDLVVSAILICLTAQAVGGIIGIVWGSQYLRLLWLFPFAASLILLAFLKWKTVKKPVLLLLCLMLAIDLLPAANIIRPNLGSEKKKTASERAQNLLSESCIGLAAENTSNRLAILDEGNLGSQGLYLASSIEKPAAIIQGDNRMFSPTEDNLSHISRALTEGHYDYVFDRLFNMGCDTILISSGELPQEDRENGGLLRSAAKKLGYKQISADGAYKVFHADFGTGLGVVSSYPALGIGEGAYETAMVYPAMDEATDRNLSHYSFEDLKDYRMIYLTDFIYDKGKKTDAEELIRRLASSGVHIAIEAEGIPESEESRDRSFLGVRCNAISFTNGFPDFQTTDGIIYPDLFPRGYSKWNSYYLEGLDDIWAGINDNNVMLPIYGSAENDNIAFIGLGLTRFQALTRDEAVGQMLSRAVDMPSDYLPEHKLVPLGIEYGKDSITLISDADDVCTGIAYQDFFESDADIYEQNNMLFVNSGENIIELKYPCFIPGLITSLIGITGVIIFPLILWLKRKKERKPV